MNKRPDLLRQCVWKTCNEVATDFGHVITFYKYKGHKLGKRKTCSVKICEEDFQVIIKLLKPWVSEQINGEINKQNIARYSTKGEL